MARRSLSTRVQILYGMVDWSNSAAATARNLFWLYFLVTIVGLDPALAGGVVLVSKLWDGVNDPLVGMLSDRLRTPWGRRRPLLLLGALPFSLGFVLIFSMPPLQNQIWLAVYYGAAYLFFDTTFTVLNVPHTALASELTEDYDERSTLAGWRATFAILASLVTAGLFKVLAENVFGPRLGEDLAGTQSGYALTALIWAGTFLLPPILLFFAVREPRRPVDSSPLDFHHTFRQVFGNRPFRLLSAMYLLSYATMEMVVVIFIWFLLYAVQVSPGVDSLVLALVMGLALLSMPAAVRLMHRFGKRNTFIGCTVVWAVNCILLSLIPAGGQLWVLLLAVLTGLVYGASSAVPWAMLADVMEEAEVSTGRRRAGSYAGYMVFFRKLASAVAIFLVGQILALSGFQEGTGVVEGVAEQPAAAVLALRLLIGGVTPVGMALAAWVALRYPLTRATHGELRSRLAAQRAGASGDEGEPSSP